MFSIPREPKDTPDDANSNARYTELYSAELEKHGMLAKTGEEEEHFKWLWDRMAEKYNDAECNE